jgi:hypothetical protein
MHMQWDGFMISCVQDFEFYSKIWDVTTTHTSLRRRPWWCRRPPAGCREEFLDPPDLATVTVAACSMFHGREICPLGFSHQGELIGEWAASEVGPGGLTIGGHGQGLGRAPWWWGWPLAPLCLIFGLRKASVKIGGSAFVSSNSENIFGVTSETQKQQKTGNWHCGILLIG